MKHPDLEDLRLLVAVARQGSLIEAGRVTGMATTTVSRRLARLESVLGTQLVQRSHAGSPLTEAGRRLVEDSEPLLGQVDAVLRDSAGGDGAMEGLLRVSAMEGLGPLVVRAIERFRARHPGVRFELDLSSRPLDLDRREADIGLRMVPPEAEGLVVRPLMDVTFGVYVAAAMKPRRTAGLDTMLSRLDAVVLGGDYAGLRESRWLAERARAVAFTAPTLGTLVEAVRAGVGVGVVPDPLVAGEAGLHRLGACEVVPAKTLWLAMTPRVARTARGRAFADHLTEVLRGAIRELDARDGSGLRLRP